MDFSLAAEEKALVDALTEILRRVCSTARIREWETGRQSFDDAFIDALVQGDFLEAGLEFGDCPSFGVLVQLEEAAGRFLAPPVFSWLSGYAAFLLGEHPLARRIAAGWVPAPLAPGRGAVRLDGQRLAGAAEAVPFLDRANSLLLTVPAEGGASGSGQAGSLPHGIGRTGLTAPRQPGQRDGACVVLVDKDAPGIQAVLVPTQSLVPQWSVRFTATPAMEIVAVGPERLAGALNRLRTCLAAWATGAGSRAIDLAVAYAKEREQFGHAIGSYQSVQNRLVDAAIQLEQARMLASRASALIDAGAVEAADVAILARHQAGKAFVQATRAAMLTFGGYGFTVDFDIQLYFRRAKEAQLGFEPRPPWQLAPGFRSE
ncbi:MAG: hypothetical protein KGJ86_04655 [Chloroflexota bacterium]|nr:hypothetical protein [Chloroflexota bacterium]